MPVIQLFIGSLQKLHGWASYMLGSSQSKEETSKLHSGVNWHHLCIKSFYDANTGWMTCMELHHTSLDLDQQSGHICKKKNKNKKVMTCMWRTREGRSAHHLNTPGVERSAELSEEKVNVLGSSTIITNLTGLPTRVSIARSGKRRIGYVTSWFWGPKKKKKKERAPRDCQRTCVTCCSGMANQTTDESGVLSNQSTPFVHTLVATSMFVPRLPFVQCQDRGRTSILLPPLISPGQRLQGEFTVQF